MWAQLQLQTHFWCLESTGETLHCKSAYVTFLSILANEMEDLQEQKLHLEEEMDENVRRFVAI